MEVACDAASDPPADRHRDGIAQLPIPGRIALRNQVAGFVHAGFGPAWRKCLEFFALQLQRCEPTYSVRRTHTANPFS